MELKTLEIYIEVQKDYVYLSFGNLWFFFRIDKLLGKEFDGTIIAGTSKGEIVDLDTGLMEDLIKNGSTIMTLKLEDIQAEYVYRLIYLDDNQFDNAREMDTVDLANSYGYTYGLNDSEIDRLYSRIREAQPPLELKFLLDQGATGYRKKKDYNSVPPMVIRTLGREHDTLYRMSQGAKRFNELRNSVFCAGELQALLTKGLIRKTPKGNYTMNPRGKKVLEQLEAIHPFQEFLDERQRIINVYHKRAYDSEETEDEKNFRAKYGWFYGDHPTRGFKYIKIPGKPNPFWVAYFRTRVW